MGIVRRLGRGAVRLLTDACEREGRRALIEALVVGEGPMVVPAPVMGIVTTAGATQSAADRTRVRRDPGAASERARVS
jgi:hypothetical protein